MPGALVGTLDYMAPEQARGEAADERTDVYAFGLILYELLAGSRPSYSKEGGLSSLLARLEKGPPPLKAVVPDVPPAVERIVNKCLSRSADARYPTATELLADMDTLRRTQSCRNASSGAARRPRSFWTTSLPSDITRRSRIGWVGPVRCRSSTRVRSIKSSSGSAKAQRMIRSWRMRGSGSAR